MAPVIPRNDSELEEMFNDGSVVKDVFSSRDGALQFVKDYANQFNKASHGDLDAQIEAGVQEGITKYVREKGSLDVSGDAKRLNLAMKANDKGRLGDRYNPNAPGAQLDGEFPDVKDFMKAIWHGSRTSEAQARRGAWSAFCQALFASAEFLYVN